MVTDEDIAYRRGRVRAIKQLWRTYRALMKRASECKYLTLRESLLMDAESVKRQLDKIRAEP